MCGYLNEIISILWFILNSEFIGAFTGAFFAFIFGLQTYHYGRRRERFKIHHDSVVKLEYLINRHLNQISGNIFLLKGALDTYNKNAFTENVLSPLENPDFNPNFYNLEIINKYADYQSLVEKVNHDMESWNRSNDRLFSAMFSGNVSMGDILLSRVNLAERTKQLISHLNDLLEETYTVGAYVREFLKEDKLGSYANLEPVENIKIPSNKILKERKVFVKQSKETMKNDRKGRLKKYNLQ